MDERRRALGGEAIDWNRLHADLLCAGAVIAAVAARRPEHGAALGTTEPSATTDQKSSKHAQDHT
jgi:hypothetical protein